MDVKKRDEESSDMPTTIGIVPGSAESLEASIRRAQEALSGVSARLASRPVPPRPDPATDRFVETDDTMWRGRFPYCLVRSMGWRPTMPAGAACCGSGW